MPKKALTASTHARQIFGTTQPPSHQFPSLFSSTSPGEPGEPIRVSTKVHTYHDAAFKTTVNVRSDMQEQYIHVLIIRYRYRCRNALYYYGSEVMESLGRA